MGKSDGTVRNVISALKAMCLVEAKTGPGGGYVPTVKGVEIARGNVALEKLWEPIRLVVDGRARASEEAQGLIHCPRRHTLHAGVNAALSIMARGLKALGIEAELPSTITTKSFIATPGGARTNTSKP